MTDMRGFSHGLVALPALEHSVSLPEATLQMHHTAHTAVG